MEEKVLEKGNGLVFIGIPRERIYLTQFVDNRDSIISYLGDKKLLGGYFQAESHRVDRNRDRIVDEFLKAKTHPEWLLMIDTDMEHPIDCGERLISYNKPIVGALYFSRGSQHHTPFMFKMIQAKNDDFGRPTLAWSPMSRMVYEFLQANGVPMRDGALSLIDPAGEFLIDCDAVATGCMVIHRSVLEDMPKPIFEYRAQGNSEDLVFCKEAKERGWKVYCDMSTICGHFHWVPMGQAQFRMNYLNEGINSTTYSKRQAATWWSDFFKIPLEDAIAEIEAGNSHMVGDLWTKKFGDKVPTPEEVDEFYKLPEVGKMYVMELLHWNFDPNFANLQQMLIRIREKNIIEIGAGIGSVSLQMLIQDNNVLAVEVNEILRDFIDLRWKDLKKYELEILPDISVVSEVWKEKCESASFDVGIALDVFEHMSEEELESTIKALSRVIKKDGRLIFHNNFQQQDLYPMHFDHSDLFQKLIEENGFVFVNEMEVLHV